MKLYFINYYCLFFLFSDPPQVILQLGSTLKPDDIKEGDDVYFECNIRANPKEHKITWFHNVSNYYINFLIELNSGF